MIIDDQSSNTQYPECQIWDKILKIGPKQVHMAPFGLILNQNRSHMVWDASGMPPGAPGAPWDPKGGTPRSNDI